MISSHSQFEFGRFLGLSVQLFFYTLLAWGLIFWRRWRQRVREGKAESWASVEGVVVGGTVKPIPKTSRHLATISYSYFAGAYEAGEYTREFASEPDADEFVRQLKDRRILIKYHPEHPTRSVLETRTVNQMVALTPKFSGRD